MHGDPDLRVLGVVAAAVLDADREREHGHRDEQQRARGGDQRRARRSRATGSGTSPSAISGAARAANTKPSTRARDEREHRGAPGGHALGRRLRELVRQRLRLGRAPHEHEPEHRQQERQRDEVAGAHEPSRGRTPSPRARQPAGTRQPIAKPSTGTGAPRSRPSQLRAPRVAVGLAEHEPGGLAHVEPDARARVALRGARVEHAARARRPRSPAGPARASAGARGRARTCRAGMRERAAPGGQVRPRRRTSGSAAGGLRRGRRRSRRRASAPAPAPSVPSRSPQRLRTRPPRGTRAIGTPAPVISRMPTARRWRSTPDAPAGNAARRISRRNVRPRSGSGSVHAAVRGDVHRAATRRRRRRSRTSVGRRTRRGPAARARSSRTVAGSGAVHSSHAVRPSSHDPIQGRGEPSNALDARKPGRPSKRPDDSNAAPRAPASASIALSFARASTVPQPSARPRARGGRRDHALQPALAVLAVAHEHGAGGAAARVAPERVVAGRALEQVRQAGAREVAAGERALGEHGRAQRLAHPHAGDAQLADPARAVRARPRARLHARDPHAQRAHAVQPELEPVPALAAPGTCGPRPRPRSPSRAGRSTAAARSSRRRAGASKPISSQWRASSSARSACQCVAVSPSKAANGRRSGNCE